MMPTANMSYDSDSKIIRSNFEDVNVMVVPLRQDEIDNIRIEDTLYAPRAGSLIDSKKAVYEKNAKGNVTFDTLLIPLDCGESFSVAMEKVDLGQEDEAASCFAFTIHNNNNNTYRRFYYYHLHDIEKKKTVDADPYTTGAGVMLVEENSKGEVVSNFVYDSTKFISTNDIVK